MRSSPDDGGRSTRASQRDAGPAVAPSPDSAIPREPARAIGLGLRWKILYGVGDVPVAAKTILAGLFGVYFYTSVMGLSGTLVGIASAISLVWDAVIDPFIGSWSDRTRIAFGRRHAFMLAGALTMGAGFWASFSPPAGLSPWTLFGWVLVSGLVLRGGMSVYRIPYFALGAELSPDYDERTSITAIRGVLSVAGTLAAAAIAFAVFFPDRAQGAEPGAGRAGYASMGLVFGMMMTLIGLGVTFGTRRFRCVGAGNREPEAPASAADLFGGFARCLRNRSYLVLLLSASLFFMASAVYTSLSIHFLTHYVKLGQKTLLALFQLAMYGGGILGMLFFLPVSRASEKHRVYNLGALGTAAVMLAVYFLLGEGRPLGTGRVLPVVVAHALAGFFGSVLWFMPATMIADVVDEDELTTGRRREGSFFGLYSFSHQMAMGLAMLLTGVLLDVYAGLLPGQAEQPAATIRRVGILACVLPAVLLVAAAATTARYGLGRAKVAEIKRRSRERLP